MQSNEENVQNNRISNVILKNIYLILKNIHGTTMLLINVMIIKKILY